MTSAIFALFLAFQSAPAGGAGATPEWDVKVKAEQTAREVARLKPFLERLQPETWTAAGAPANYEKQWKECLAMVGYVQNAAGRLAAQPGRLSLAVETLVRLETLVQYASGVSDAVRRYQNPAIAEVLDSEIVSASFGREWLRQHVTELSAAREKELELAEQEAQRCRAQNLKQGR